MAAFSIGHPLSLDIYENLYQHFFKSDIFQAWRSRKSKWRLHCSGNPGCGKTTLAAHTIKYLKKLVPAVGIPVVSIFACRDVCEEEKASPLLEEFLELIIVQLKEERASRSTAESNTTEIHDSSNKSIRHALDDLLSSLSGAFVIFDGLDRCSEALKSQLEAELPRLQDKGLQVMVTSRYPLSPRINDGELMWTQCDGHNDELEIVDKAVHWTCKSCRNFDCCDDWKKKSGTCGKCESDNLVEPYSALNYNLENPGISETTMKAAISWYLELEHGEIGLTSEVKDEFVKPPLSVLGRELRRNISGAASNKLVKWIFDKSGGNMSLARLRLDSIHAAQTVGEVHATQDRLPANIVHLFNAFVSTVEASASGDGPKIGLLCLAAVADGPEPLPKLLKILDEFLPCAAEHQVDEVLRATKGFLMLLENNPVDLRAYHLDFDIYLMDDYNAKIKLRRGQINEWRTRKAQEEESSEPAA